MDKSFRIQSLSSRLVTPRRKQKLALLDDKKESIQQAVFAAALAGINSQFQLSRINTAAGAKKGIVGLEEEESECDTDRSEPNSSDK